MAHPRRSIASCGGWSLGKSSRGYAAGCTGAVRRAVLACRAPPSAPQADALRKAVGSDVAVGATGWHAANLLGLSTQVAPVESLVVTHRRPEGLKKINVSTRAARRARRDAKLNGLEVTFLEALEGWDRYVEADSATALRRFVDVLARDDMRVERLVAASRTEPPAVRERLRAVLGHAGHTAEADRVRRARDPRTRERALRVLRGSS